MKNSVKNFSGRYSSFTNGNFLPMTHLIVQVGQLLSPLFGQLLSPSNHCSGNKITKEAGSGAVLLFTALQLFESDPEADFQNNVYKKLKAYFAE